MTRLRRHDPAAAEFQRMSVPGGSAPSRDLHRDGSGVDGDISASSVVDGRDLAQLAELREQLWGLQQRQLHQAVIEQAKGMLMGYYGVGADDAFAMLRRWSQHSNTKVREISAELVAAGSQPGQHSYSAVHSVLRSCSFEIASAPPPMLADGRSKTPPARE